MKNILVFSGTSEGKFISEALSEASIYHTVFVATEYGKLVMEPSFYANIKEGRMDEEDMEKLFKEGDFSYVVDATHPYATIVTQNIKKACEKAGCLDLYIRVARKTEILDESVISVDSTKSAIEKLLQIDGNILLTTGVKSLPEYMGNDGLKDRIYARILPSIESLSLALDTKIKPGHIIAQEGPFNVESNEALISQYDIKVLVTKNSGEKGGFKEKLLASYNKGVKAIVIEQEATDDGISAEEAIKILTGREYKNTKVCIAGIGVGDVDTLTLAAKNAIEKADLIIGAKRMADFGQKINPKAKIIYEYEADKIADAIDDNNAKYPVILMSGDTGFHSGASKAKKVLKEKGYSVNLLPGISSISYFASLIGWDYDSGIYSIHGDESDLEKIDSLDKFFFILSGPEDVKKITSRLSDSYEIAVGYNLGYDDMTVDISMRKNIKEYKEKGLYVLAARKV